jgi:hypothetical protein
MASRFLIEIPHEATMDACLKAIEAVLTSGSHLLTHAEWGCKDGAHKAWLIVDVDSKEIARGLVPPAFRSQATVVALNTFTLSDMQAMAKQHGG